MGSAFLFERSRIRIRASGGALCTVAVHELQASAMQVRTCTQRGSTRRTPHSADKFFAGIQSAGFAAAKYKFFLMATWEFSWQNRWA